jgi:hypothetical protein
MTQPPETIWVWTSTNNAPFCGSWVDHPTDVHGICDARFEREDVVDKLREFIDKAFEAHPNLDLDIEALCQ